jgi:predicted ArsR family transcriptional regulator
MNKVNQSTYARVFKLLLHDPATAHEIVEETGLHIITAQSLMRTLRRHRVVHICAWERDSMGRDAIPVYRLGEGKDKARRKMTAAERQAKHRAKEQQLDALMGMRTPGGHRNH